MGWSPHLKGVVITQMSLYMPLYIPISYTVILQWEGHTSSWQMFVEFLCFQRSGGSLFSSGSWPPSTPPSSQRYTEDLSSVYFFISARIVYGGWLFCLQCVVPWVFSLMHAFWMNEIRGPPRTPAGGVQKWNSDIDFLNFKSSSGEQIWKSEIIFYFEQIIERREKVNWMNGIIFISL